MTPPEYHLRTAADFLSVPADRRDICLREFGVWLDIVSATLILMDGIPAKTPEDFHWIDDDKHTVEVAITDGKTRVEVASGVMRGFK